MLGHIHIGHIVDFAIQYKAIGYDFQPLYYFEQAPDEMLTDPKAAVTVSLDLKHNPFMRHLHDHTSKHHDALLVQPRRKHKEFIFAGGRPFESYLHLDSMTHGLRQWNLDLSLGSTYKLRVKIFKGWDLPVPAAGAEVTCQKLMDAKNNPIIKHQREAFELGEVEDEKELIDQMAASEYVVVEPAKVRTPKSRAPLDKPTQHIPYLQKHPPKTPDPSVVWHVAASVVTPGNYVISGDVSLDGMESYRMAFQAFITLED